MKLGCYKIPFQNPFQDLIQVISGNHSYLTYLNHHLGLSLLNKIHFYFGLITKNLFITFST